MYIFSTEHLVKVTSGEAGAVDGIVSVAMGAETMMTMYDHINESEKEREREILLCQLVRIKGEVC